MTDPNDDSTTLENALAESRSTDGMTRDHAIYSLAEYIHDGRAVERLHEMLDDEIVTMQVDAADVLARRGGKEGIFLVLDEIGRRRDDPDADYMANRLYELDASGEIEILDIIEPVRDQLSDNGAIGFQQLKRLRGRE
ncbi:hypothetical protein [Nocardia sp. NPDC019395]|uniref:hypothetical protein n=1 Tax=Nocardia sp. NPDC019395 TaxID=3154686 RepID=UPI0033CD2DC2